MAPAGRLDQQAKEGYAAASLLWQEVQSPKQTTEVRFKDFDTEL
jgi:hypothetical protein